MDEKQVALLSAGVSIFAAILSCIFSSRALQAQTLANRVQATGVRNQYFAELRKWADEACELLSSALHLCDLVPAKCQSPSFFDRRHEVLCRLSGIIDRGRWFFPNDKQEGVGVHKREAFQGYRHVVLDSLVQGYRLVEKKLDYQQKAPDKELRKAIEDEKRKFISEVQSVLNPRGREEEFNRIMQKPK